MESLSNHLKQTKKNDIFWYLSKVSLIPLTFLIGYFITGFIILLVVFLLLVLFLYFTSFKIWNNHFNKRLDEAKNFIGSLESKTEDLSKSLRVLSSTQLEKDLYWIDFKIDSTTFEIRTITHSTVPNSKPEIESVKTSLFNLLRVDKSTIQEYKKIGWEADDNLELLLELTQRWFSDIWNQERTKDLKIRATFSVHDRVGHFNLNRRKWEDLSFFFGKPLQ